MAETVKLLKWVQICSLEILFFPGRKILHMLQSSTISNLLIFLIWKLLNSDSSIKKMRQTGVLENIITKYSLEKAEVSIWNVLYLILFFMLLGLLWQWIECNGSGKCVWNISDPNQFSLHISSHSHCWMFYQYPQKLIITLYSKIILLRTST